METLIIIKRKMITLKFWFVIFLNHKVIQFLSLLSMTNRLFLAFAQVCLHCSLLYFTFYVPVSSGGACFFIVWDWSAFVPAFNARALIALQSITCEREKIKITVLAARLPACPPARLPASPCSNIITIASCFRDLENLVNIVLENIGQWLVANKLSLNVTKTEYILARDHHLREH